MSRNTINVNNVQDVDSEEKFLRTWPHIFNPALAYLGCTLGLLNIDRFATLSIQFGANFILQFLIVSFLFGIPFFILQVCLGQKLNTGVLNMWKISPLFQGVGIALLLVQACIGIYTIIGVSWMFVYLRDAFIAKEDAYKWTKTVLLNEHNVNPLNNSTVNKIIDSVPDYFSRVVLQRQNLTKPHLDTSTFKFQVGFNLAVVWIIIFISLSKGLQSYGKVIYFYTLIPILTNLVFCAKIISLAPHGSLHENVSDIGWNEFFNNGKSWIAASSEAFFTWGLLSVAAMQIAAHNKNKRLLGRDTAFVIVSTLLVLLVNAFIANTCIKILGDHGYLYKASSFEKISSYKFLRYVDQRASPSSNNTKENMISHSSFLIGQRIIQSDNYLINVSGYQALRFSTELVPSTIALLTTEQITPFWTLLFYLTLTLFGICQQLAIWHCVTMGIFSLIKQRKKGWETRITFLSCVCAYILGLPMTSELGIYVIYYLDYVIGSSWWIMIVYLTQFTALFAFRGRPYTGETIVAELFQSADKCLRDWAGSLLSFIWNIFLPIMLGILSVVIFKSGGFRELYLTHKMGKYNWTIWEKQLGISIQLLPILIIPVVAIVQTYRYLNKGPTDIFERLQLLCRPSLEFASSQNSQEGLRNASSGRENEVFCSTAELIFEDLPPKYTPPPSYSTATGAKIAKILRQSFRRSIRRIGNILGENNILRSRSILPPSSPSPEYKG